MVAQEERQVMSVEQWRRLLQTSPIKYEYIDGWVYAMAGGSLAHSRIGINAVRILEDALEGRACWVYNSDAAARLSPKRYTFPDATVSCDMRDRPTVGQTEIQAPRVIVEVLSDTTEAYDRGDKFGYYRACPTIHEYVLVATKHQAVEVFSRTTDGWTTYRAYDPDESVHLTVLDVRFPVAALYRGTEVPRTPDEPEGEV